MTTRLQRKRRAGVAAAALCLLAMAAVTFAACSSSQGAAPESGIIAAITTLDKAGLHGIDTAINTDKTIPPTARTTALQLQAVTLLTEWPKELRGQAKSVAAALGELAAAVDGDKPDLAKAGAAAKKAHDVEHDFSHEVWDHLYDKAGVKTGAEGDAH